MELKPGDVVILKSGGHPVTVAEVNAEDIVCLWMGSEGDLFRESFPLVVLEMADGGDPDEDEDDKEEGDEDENEDDGHEEHEEHEHGKSKVA